MGVKVRTRVPVPVGPDFAEAMFHSFEGLAPEEEHFLVAFGPYEGQEVPLVRIHSECITGDLFGSQRCDCGAQLQEAVETLQQQGGYLVYLRQEGRGIGLYNKLDAYVLQDRGLDTYQANRSLRFPDDLRAFRPAAEMLRAVDLERVRLITNNPQKVEELQSHGVEVVEVLPTGVYINEVNSRYLHSKALYAHHTLSLSDPKPHTRGTEAAT